MFTKTMFFNKIITKSRNFIICLTVSAITYSIVTHSTNKKVLEDCFPKHLYKYLNVEERVVTARARARARAGVNTSLDVDELRADLHSLNKGCEVRNVREYGPVRPDTPFLVVRVHRGLERLRLLVASLAQAAGVDDLLLIFSHSYYDHGLNYLIHQIDFCMVMQIFYLNSVQLNPHSFPGFDPVDANGTTNGRRSTRDPRLAELKHHWWWTVNFVFDKLVWQEQHTEMVMFIDENSYVLPDALFMFASAKYAMNYFPDADVISLGRASANGGSDYDRVTLEVWGAAHGNGLAFNRSTWQRISALRWRYCEYDDTSWRHSLLHLFGWFPGGRAVAVSTLVPRVLPASAVRGSRDLCRLTAPHRLFPRKVEAVVLFGREGKVLSSPEVPAKGNGGWSDYRDVFHCYETTTAEENVTMAFPEPD